MTHRKTNISNLDEALGGGLKKNTVTVLWSHPGIENSLFAYHILNESLKDGENAVYITNCRGINAVEADMKCCGYDISKYRAEKKLVFVDAFSGLIRKKPAEKYFPEDAKDASSVTKSLEEALTTVKDDHTLVVCDSLCTMINHCGAESIDLIPEWRKIFSENNATGLLLFTEWPYEEHIINKVSNASDAIIQLKAIEKNRILQKYLTIPKVTWTEIKKELYIPFKVIQNSLILQDPKEFKLIN